MVGELVIGLTGNGGGREPGQTQFGSVAYGAFGNTTNSLVSQRMCRYHRLVAQFAFGKTTNQRMSQFVRRIRFVGAADIRTSRRGE